MRLFFNLLKYLFNVAASHNAADVIGGRSGTDTRTGTHIHTHLQI